MPEVYSYLLFKVCVKTSLSLSPQTMAVATLAVCYNNPSVFTRVVKIRKGQAVALMMASSNMTQLHVIMTQFAEEVSQQQDHTSPLYIATSLKLPLYVNQ